MTNGPDGALWFTEEDGNRIGRVTTAGQVQEFPLPRPASAPLAIAAGSDGALWFTMGDSTSPATIGRIDLSGTVQEYPLAEPGSQPVGITVGPDGAMWFTEFAGNRIGRIDVTTGVITEFALPEAGIQPEYVAAGPDGNLWFTSFDGAFIGRMTPAGAVTLLNANAPNFDIVVGADGNLWYSGFSQGTIGQASLSRLELTTQAVASSTIIGVAAGPDGNVWFTSSGGAIGYYRLQARLSFASASVTPTVAPGGDITMTVVAANTGPDDAGAPRIELQLDPRVAVVDQVLPPGWTCTFSESRGSCTGVQVVSAESVTLTFTGRVSPAATPGAANASVIFSSTTPHGTDPSVVLSTQIVAVTPPTTASTTTTSVVPVVPTSGSVTTIPPTLPRTGGPGQSMQSTRMAVGLIILGATLVVVTRRRTTGAGST